MEIQLLGIGGLRVGLAGRNIFIDAFNVFFESPALAVDDIVLFTHSDDDHFCPQKTSEAVNDQTIVGPPSITKALWDMGKVTPKQLRISYPCEFEHPEPFTFGDLEILVFNTEHFIGWHNQHISFLLRWKGVSVYITGDSWIRPENRDQLKNLDVLVYSLAKEDVVKGRMPSSHGIHHHLCELMDLQRRLSPKLIVGNHLIGADWTVDPRQMAALVHTTGLEGIEIPTDQDTVLRI